MANIFEKIRAHVHEQNYDVAHIAGDLLIKADIPSDKISSRHLRKELRRLRRIINREVARVKGSDDPGDLERITLIDGMIDRAFYEEVHRTYQEYGHFYANLANIPASMKVRHAESQKRLEKQKRKIQTCMNKLVAFYADQTPDPDAPPELYAMKARKALETAAARRAGRRTRSTAAEPEGGDNP